MQQESLTKNESLTLEHIDGRKASVNAKRGTKIASGGFADIYPITVEIDNNQTPFIQKKYRGDLARRNSERAFENYQLAKKAGLKVLPTFRLLREENSIVMTTGLTDQTVCVSSNENNSTSLEKFGFQKIKSIPNFNELLDGVFEQAIKGNEKNIATGRDAFLFFINTDTGHIDFFVGEMDYVRQDKNRADLERAENIWGARHALELMIKNNVEEPNDLVKMVIQKFKTVRDQFRLPHIYGEE